MRKNKGASLGEKILRVLQAGTVTSAEFFDLFTTHTYKGIRYPSLARIIKAEDWAAAYHTRRAVATRISQLKKDGLITLKGHPGKEQFVLSDLGKKRFQKYALTKRPAERYQKQSGASVVIFSYDIPQGFHRERAWLRTVLRFLEYEMVQQSLWIGKMAVPELLMRDLGEKGIAEYVHIFEVGKMGTLEERT